jgi:multiple sugar transport system ATP-binding protein
MAFGLRLRKMDKKEIERRVDNAAKILGITELLKRKPRQLSGGQRQRVAVGRAIVREPNVFLLDEPLSNLDAKLRVQTRAELSKLHKDLATTFIYVTHDQVEAMTMATRIAVMNFGVLQQIDTPHNLYEAPANKFVAGFIGSPAMNFFDAKVSKADGKLMLDAGSFQIEAPKSKVKLYEPYAGKSVTLGIRPEDIHNTNFTPSGVSPAKVDAQVEVVELMGNEIVAYLKTGPNSYVARVDPRSDYKFGDKVQVAFNAENVHLFDRETEKAIR